MAEFRSGLEEGGAGDRMNPQQSPVRLSALRGDDLKIRIEWMDGEMVP
jgi:hypothetical protein